jgi:hypothetical protein
VSACELCWAEAFAASRTGPESQAEAYHRLLKENEGKEGHGAACNFGNADAGGFDRRGPRVGF